MLVEQIEMVTKQTETLRYQAEESEKDIQIQQVAHIEVVSALKNEICTLKQELLQFHGDKTLDDEAAHKTLLSELTVLRTQIADVSVIARRQDKNLMAADAKNHTLKECLDEAKTALAKQRMICGALYKQLSLVPTKDAMRKMHVEVEESRIMTHASMALVNALAKCLGEESRVCVAACTHSLQSIASSAREKIADMQEQIDDLRLQCNFFAERIVAMVKCGPMCNGEFTVVPLKADGHENEFKEMQQWIDLQILAKAEVAAGLLPLSVVTGSELSTIDMSATSQPWSLLPSTSAAIFSIADGQRHLQDQFTSRPERMPADCDGEDRQLLAQQFENLQVKARFLEEKLLQAEGYIKHQADELSQSQAAQQEAVKQATLAQHQAQKSQNLVHTQTAHQILQIEAIATSSTHDNTLAPPDHTSFALQRLIAVDVEKDLVNSKSLCEAYQCRSLQQQCQLQQFQGEKEQLLSENEKLREELIKVQGEMSTSRTRLEVLENELRIALNDNAAQVEKLQISAETIQFQNQELKSVSDQLLQESRKVTSQQVDAEHLRIALEQTRTEPSKALGHDAGIHRSN